MKKLLLFFWCLYFSATCKQGIPTADLVFINANTQSWSGGAAGSGHGINYNFYFIKKGIVTCDSVWVEGFVLPVTTDSKGDTLHIKAQAYFRGMAGVTNGQANIDPKQENPPTTIKAAALISISNGKTKKLITVPAIKRLQPLAYP